MLILKVIWSYFAQMRLIIMTDTLALMTDTTLKQKKKTLQNREMRREKQTFRDLLLCVFLTFLIQGKLTYTTGCFYF